MSFQSLYEDVRYAIRSLLRDPVLVLAAAATLAISIGANTAVFSIVNTVLLRPLPYPGSERLDWIADVSGKRRMDMGAGPDYYTIRAQQRVFEDVAAFNTTTLNWTGIEKPEQLDAGLVTPSFFRVLATPPLLGRPLASREEGENAPPVVVLSFAFWRSRMGGDPRVVGKTMMLDGVPNTVIGVMPQGFDYPQGSQIWKPLEVDEASALPIMADRPILIVRMLAKRKAGVSQVELDTEMKRLSLAIRDVYPAGIWRDDLRSGLTLSTIPLQRHIAGDLRPALAVLSGAVGLVLLIACVNLANLLLARASARGREFAVRLALGSARIRLVRQLLTESLVLALPGGLAGIAIGWGAVALLNTTKPLVLARYPLLQVDWRTLAFTLAITVATSLIFGLAPAWTAVRISIHDSLKGASRTQTGGHRSARLRHVLVISELSISLILLIGAGLLARSFVKLASVDLGFAADHLLTMRMDLTSSRYVKPASRRAFYDDVLNRVRQLPIVRAAEISSDLPLSQFNSAVRFGAQSHPLPLAERLTAGFGFVGFDYFRGMGIRVERGRTFDSRDANRSDPVLVVNQALARTVFPGDDAIGQRLVAGPRDELLGTIIGVVASTRGAALGAEPMPLIYQCMCQDSFRQMNRVALIVRTTGDPTAAIPAVEGQIYAVDREQPISDVRTMEARVANSLAPQRFQLILIGTFAGIALILAAAGLYGVMSYLVARRNREIGIRMALGARPAQIRGLVVRESLALVAISAVTGLAGAWALTRYVRSMLYGITTLDAPTFALTPLVLTTIIFLASLGPAGKAAGVDPMTALRDE